MAKGKINALVTVEEQPYSVPENWNWFYLGALSEVMCDGVHYAPEYLNSGIPCFSAKDIYDDDIHLDKCNFISNDEYEGMKSKLNVKDNSLLVTKSGSIGRTAIVEKAYPFGLVESIGVVNTKYVSVHYVKRLLDMGFVYSSEFLEQYTTGTTIKHLTLRLLGNIKVPLPPEAEQQRIVDRIESLFAKLDEAKEKAQAVVDGFEDRKAAILHKAFTGELTVEWRNKQLQGEKQWVKCLIGDLFFHTTGKALKKDNHIGIRRKYITTSNLYWGRFDLVEVREMYFTEEELQKCTATKGDLLICNGGDVGRAAIWQYEYDICLQNHISKLRKKKNNVSILFFYYYFMLSKIKGLVNGKGIGISSLSAKDLLSMTVDLPPIEEQIVISSILDGYFAKMDRAKEVAEKVITQIDTMKNSILARAFRGELGTNDPSESPADIGIS